MANVKVVKKLPGIPEEDHVVMEINDNLISTLQVANWRAGHTLDRSGRRWGVVQFSTPATSMINRGEVVEFYLDGVKKVGFIPSAPVGSFSVSQGVASQTWSGTILFLEDV